MYPGGSWSVGEDLILYICGNEHVQVLSAVLSINSGSTDSHKKLARFPIVLDLSGHGSRRFVMTWIQKACLDWINFSLVLGDGSQVLAEEM